MAAGSVVLPGDKLPAADSAALGPGARRDEDGVAYSTVAGVVRGREGQKMWVDFNSKRVREFSIILAFRAVWRI